MQNLLINHCAPVLGGLKTGNLFNYKTDRKSALEQCNNLIPMLLKKGISVEIIKASDSYSLIYVYRKNNLEEDVKDELASKILYERGYKSSKAEDLIEHLKFRIEKCNCFPHEIGLFLSYPPEDVLGFIENKGYDFKLCGYWKVYCNEENALKKFEMYKHCTAVFVKRFKMGIRLEDLLVAI